ncbi:3-deoxy-8-phosphooctulonate synthase [Rickettsiales endosymbiont of Stachyamoeba lipophora]|uniref:3-deoxy-8-phosphooctulonate synthase n=1 Tax=Rickettsiales endosymbiont of Stachyamoeba lipophora TaxID=2486578 RepID=UPI000F654CAA|nr:3-deoxy-8-phosphooctulonate synthase [Rickettsiales endosymbiont of Stachyamoeba lipophora]AZL15473.1 3-deoxy-8-phosphooctulonate synthase [Rickettsiales endosymbiont of Stachyamoeba lipophora]
MVKEINLGTFKVSNNLPFTLIAGPCQMESRDHSMFMAERIKQITDRLNINLIYKTSFDKANRSSIQGERGIGLEKSLKIFEEIKNTFECPVITDVHNETQCEIMATVVDILQIPAFLCRQTDLLIAAAKTGKVINVKKGQFMAPWDSKNIVDKIEQSGNPNYLITERGVSFGYNTLVSDMRALKIIADMDIPVVFDATHSVQQPGGLGNQSGGQREFVEVLARAAVAVGVAAVFIETHQDPDNAPSDGKCMLHLSDLEKTLSTLKALDQIVKN